MYASCINTNTKYYPSSDQRPAPSSPAIVVGIFRPAPLCSDFVAGWLWIHWSIFMVIVCITGGNHKVIIWKRPAPPFYTVLIPGSSVSGAGLWLGIRIRGEFGGVPLLAASVQSLILVQLSFSYANTPEHFPFLPCLHTLLYSIYTEDICVCVPVARILKYPVYA